MSDSKKDDLADALAAMTSGEASAEGPEVKEGEKRLVEGESQGAAVPPTQPIAAPNSGSANPLEQPKPKTASAPALTMRPVVVRKSPVAPPKPTAPAPTTTSVRPAAPISNRPTSPARPVMPKPMPTPNPRPATPVPAVVRPTAPNSAPAKHRPANPIAPVNVGPVKMGDEPGIITDASVSNANEDTDAAIQMKAAPEEAKAKLTKDVVEGEVIEAATDDFVMMEDVAESLSPKTSAKKRVVQTPLTQRLEFKQTVIPILLTSSALMLIFSIAIFSGWDEFPLEGQTGMAIAMLISSVFMATAAVLNMLQVKHLLSQKQ